MGRLRIVSSLCLLGGAFMKVAFDAIDQKRSAENQVTEAAKVSRKRRQLSQAAASTSDASYEAGAF